MRSGFAKFVVRVQATIFAAHAVVYWTWTSFSSSADPPGISSVQLIFVLLSVSFVSGSFLAWRYSHVIARVFYKIAAVWLGALNFCFIAACCWLIYGAALVFGYRPSQPVVAQVLFGLAIAVSIYGVVNAAWTRVRM
ncbi:MAG: hypothetical protein HYX72_07045 [Acidobacteria bacterium]|nr:hypothetical protein [Acidobacteriota bacterium]